VTPSEAPVAPSFDPRELGRHQRHIGLQLGLHTRFVDDPALDPFAEEDAVAAFSVALGMTALTLDRSSLVAMAGWEAGGTSADARGDQASLTTNRFWVAPELRHHLWPTLYAFARPALGAVRTRAQLDSASMGAEFSGTAWAASFELSAGLAYEVFGARDPNAKRARGWVLLDGGYGWSGASHLELDAEDSLRAAPLDLGDLHWRGGQFGIHLALTY
jgi:hypothetical protein